MKNRTNFPLPLWPTIVAAIFLAASVLIAVPPDLTSGGTPDTSRTINLGPTGMRGWVYHVNGSGKAADTSESRQILVNSVDQGSPAAGKLAAAMSFSELFRMCQILNCKPDLGPLAIQNVAHVAQLAACFCRGIRHAPPHEQTLTSGQHSSLF